MFVSVINTSLLGTTSELLELYSRQGRRLCACTSWSTSNRRGSAGPTSARSPSGRRHPSPGAAASLHICPQRLVLYAGPSRLVLYAGSSRATLYKPSLRVALIVGPTPTALLLPPQGSSARTLTPVRSVRPPKRRWGQTLRTSELSTRRTTSPSARSCASTTTCTSSSTIP